MIPRLILPLLIFLPGIISNADAFTLTSESKADEVLSSTPLAMESSGTEEYLQSLETTTLEAGISLGTMPLETSPPLDTTTIDIITVRASEETQTMSWTDPTSDYPSTPDTSTPDTTTEYSLSSSFSSSSSSSFSSSFPFSSSSFPSSSSSYPSSSISSSFSSSFSSPHSSSTSSTSSFSFSSPTPNSYSPSSSSSSSSSSPDYSSPPNLPPNLKSMSLVLFNASSSLGHSPSSLSYKNNNPSPPPPPPPPHEPHANHILDSILPLTPDFSFSATQEPPSPSSSSPSSSLPEEEEEEEEEQPSPSSSATSMNEGFAVTYNADSILNLTGELGGSVFMPCTTHHSMERQVSWVRRRDWHILTSGTLAYTKEERFSVHHPEGSTDWTLVIKYIQLDDAGTYECQVSTGTGILSRLVELNVVVPKAVIPGNGEYHIDIGSTITLDCYIHQSLVAPQYIFWYHNSRMINYDRERGGVSVQIDTGPQVRSRLTVKRATAGDSGNYTCHAANSKPAFTTVYITNGNKIAAIQPRAMAGQPRLHNCLSVLLISILCHILHRIH